MLTVVRHGQTAANVSGLFLGRADPPLTDLGRRQAGTIASALPRPQRVISSPLARARDTAEAFGLPVEIDERWIEMDYGMLDERPVASLAQADWQRWRADVDHAPGGGESIAAVGRRVREACAAVAADAADTDVVVVSHVSPIKATVAWVLGTGDEVAWRMWVDDAAVCRIAIGRHGPVLHSFNEPVHRLGR